jgi:hypothetical protein
LGDVVGIVGADAVGAELPHVALAVFDESAERGAVAVAGREQQSRELVHRG